MSGSVLAGLALDATLTGGTQETQVVDASGNPAGSLDCTNLRGLAVAQSGTYFAACPGNTTTAQLAASATFTGTVENFFNQQTISVIGVCDQPLTITVLQYIDAGGTKQVASQQFTTTGGVGFNRAIAGAGNYFRITAQNTGASTTTTLHIDTVVGTLQSQTQAGNLPVALSEVGTGVTLPVQVTDRTAAVSIAANATSSGQITGLSQAATVTLQLNGTWTATLQIQVTRDGTNWANITGSNSIINVATGAYVASGNITANGIYQCGVEGMAGVRVITTAYTPSNTVTGTLAVSAAQAIVAIDGVPAVTVSSGTITTVTTVTTVSTVTTCNTVSSVTAANLAIPGIIADLTSTALAAGTTNSATITPTFGCSYVVGVVVSATSGTSPVLDLVVQESDDTAGNWRDVYHFPRISAAGNWRSPKLPLTGNRIRYVQTVGGTSTPTVTRVVNRLQCSDSVGVCAQLIDRTVSLTTLNAATGSINVGGVQNGVMLTINIGAATTPPTLQLEGSDDNGASWYSVGTALAAVASSTVSLTVPNVSPGLLRARVSSAGNTVTTGYTLIRGF